MSGWRSIEEMANEPIWVLKYSLYHTPDGNFCEADTSGAIKFTDCHGWYETEAEALTVLRHFPAPNSYQIEKVWKRRLLSKEPRP